LAEVKNDFQVHRAVSRDGTDIAGRIQGEGPPLVLVHAGLGDGDSDWKAALPYLTDTFTCYTMSTRNRGLSGQSADLSLERLVEDVVAFVESIGEPVGLAAPSGGGIFALGAAAQSQAIAAVAVYEPIVFDIIGEEDAEHFEDAVNRMSKLSSEGKPAEAVYDWMTGYADEEELAALSASGWLDGCQKYIPALLGVLERADESKGPGPTDPSVLKRIAAPVLIMQGANTQRTWFNESADYAHEHVANSTIIQIPGAGHSGVWVNPEPILVEMKYFLKDNMLG
jgi:pimeloyl-ACP methyl ester carboxylesterase